MRKPIVLFVLLFAALCSAKVQLISPVSSDFSEPLVISPVGTGHEFVLQFERDSGHRYMWDDIKVVNKIDSDWNVTTSSDYGYLYANILVPKDKPSAVYTFVFELSKPSVSDSETAEVKVYVTHDPSKLVLVEPFTGENKFDADTTGNVSLSVKHLAFSNARYTVRARIVDFPSYSEYVQTFKLSSNETQKIDLPFKLPQDGVYTLRADITSEANSDVDSSQSTKLIIKPTISSKLKSISEGFPLVPMTMAPFFALLGLFGF